MKIQVAIVDVSLYLPTAAHRRALNDLYAQAREHGLMVHWLGDLGLHMLTKVVPEVGHAR